MRLFFIYYITTLESPILYIEPFFKLKLTRESKLFFKIERICYLQNETNSVEYDNTRSNLRLK